MAALIDLKTALIVAVPTLTNLTRPLDTVATLAFEVFQIASAVTSRVEPSVKSPLAVNCFVNPTGTEMLSGVMVIERGKALDTTARVAAPLNDPRVALMIVFPTPTVVATPSLPAAVLTVATSARDEAHCTEVLMSRVLPSW